MEVSQVGNIDDTKKLYAKEQQIKLINIILRSLCTKELTKEGRSFLEKMKSDLRYEIQIINDDKNRKTSYSGK